MYVSEWQKGEGGLGLVSSLREKKNFFAPLHTTCFDRSAFFVLFCFVFCCFQFGDLENVDEDEVKAIEKQFYNTIQGLSEGPKDSSDEEHDDEEQQGEQDSESKNNAMLQSL